MISHTDHMINYDFTVISLPVTQPTDQRRRAANKLGSPGTREDKFAVLAKIGHTAWDGHAGRWPGSVFSPPTTPEAARDMRARTRQKGGAAHKAKGTRARGSARAPDTFEA